MPLASINDTELHYAVEGEGIPCLVPSTAAETDSAPETGQTRRGVGA